MFRRTLITGGGTAGHVYPALSLIQYLRDPHSSPSIRSERLPLIYIGSSGGVERTLVPRTEILTRLFPMAPPSSWRGVFLLTFAFLRSLALLARARPRVSFATGGYVCVPAVLASWMLRVPIVLFLPDIVPGRAVSALVPLARRVAVSTEDGLLHVPTGKGVVTGYPVRQAFGGLGTAMARARMDIPEATKVLCVFGGSQGARSINQALAACLPDILDQAHVIHVSGAQRLHEARLATAGLSETQSERYHLFPYLHDEWMAAALEASDLALCRSGASILGELPATATPAVLVPLPDTRVHQRENAEYLARRGAAVILEDDDLTRLGTVVCKLLANDVALREMAAACRRLMTPGAAQAISAVIHEVTDA